MSQLGRLPPWATLAVAGLVLAAAGCDRSGTCEYRYDTGSRDGSIPAGLETCMDRWEEGACHPGTLAGATQGLKTSGHVFTKGASCEARGFKECAAGRGVFYKTCPDAMPRAATPAATALQGAPAAPPAPAATSLAAPLAVPADAPFRGPADAKVVMQVFCDYQDPFTARFWQTLDAQFQHRPDLKIVVRHNPLPFHQGAPLAHQAALEALAQKGPQGFWTLHALLVANPKGVDRATLVGHAKAAQLDVAAFEKALDAGTHAARVQQDVEVAKGAGLQASPIAIIDTRILRGAQPAAAIEVFIAGGP